MRKLLILGFLIGFFHFNVSFAQPNPIQERAKQEEKITPNSFAINFYKPTYILPYYYTGSPDNSVYKNNTPSNQSIKHSEFKFQLSFKVPLWKNMFNTRSSLFLAYTQLSYWQLYNNDPFFRETDYEPELFLANEINMPIGHKWNWKLNFLNLGFVHQSNGYGGSLERSWNRAYLEAIFARPNWMISFKPWLVFQDHALTHNPDIAKYLGYGQFVIALKLNKEVLTLELRNLIESGTKRAAAQVTWSFPLFSYFNGYIQGFSGYGQSLIEYNHRTNSIGFGIALSNWI